MESCREIQNFLKMGEGGGMLFISVLAAILKSNMRVVFE
jgi:hypothetical protein